MAEGAGKANQQWTRNPHRHPAAGRMGNMDPAERLADMDADGIDVEVLYSELSGFRYFNLMGSAEAGNAATRAFNDALTAWSADPKRLVVSYQLPLHDIDAAVAEVERVASINGKSLQLPVFPTEVGLPDYFDERYDPLWSAITETDLPICCHIGLNTSLNSLAQRDPTPQRGIMVSQVPLMTTEAFGMWTMGGILERFPDLKLVFVETQLGWIPWYLHIIDDLATRQRYEFPAIKELPSFYFRATSTSPSSRTRGWRPTPVTTSASTRSCGRPTTRTRCRAGRTPRRSSWIRVGTLSQEEQDLMLCGNAERVWHL